MEQPKPDTFRENVEQTDDKEVGVPGIDVFAKSGMYKAGDLPGTDTYDDGLNEKGQIVMPGSTSTGSGGIYMEDNGPNDLRRRNEEETAPAEEGGLNVSGEMKQQTLAEGSKDEEPQDNLYAGEDAAAKWLRENDPNAKGNRRGMS